MIRRLLHLLSEIRSVDTLLLVAVIVESTLALRSTLPVAAIYKITPHIDYS